VRTALAREGEQLAADHLVHTHGFARVAVNLRVAVEDVRGELDVVVQDARIGLLVVCEVKTRTVGSGAEALISLGERQQRRIRRLTGVLLATGGLSARRVRFDLIAVDVLSRAVDAPRRLTHVADAW
jgi:putative endonuclease